MTAAEARSFKELVPFPPAAPTLLETHGTTVLALRFDKGVLLLADRRATAGNLIMYDLADKIFPLDDSTVVAISGAFARSVEVCRYLKHSFKYYRRSVLQEMSLEGKLTEISRALAGNAPMAMQGIGVFLPIVAAYDKQTGDFGVYFFDGAGARFQNGSYACAGSGSERIRGVFEYIARMKGQFHDRPLDEVLSDGLQMLDIAADLDSATGGFNKILPVTRVLDSEGNRDLPEDMVRKASQKVLRGSKT
ncbi:MAG: proteasome beta subunit [Fimbriimonadaceae bacterium]|jgi:proteasome beta subunit|nr:proteasome beta subunit [Fimbriimonadaceae bacterium]